MIDRHIWKAGELQEVSEKKAAEPEPKQEGDKKTDANA